MTIEPFPAVRRRADGDEADDEADVRRVDKRTSRRQNSKRALDKNEASLRPISRECNLWFDVVGCGAAGKAIAPDAPGPPFEAVH